MDQQNLNLYHIFHTVARCKNISAAAGKLYISQPAISKSIAKLEQALDVKLFSRSSRGVTLTTEGELLFKQVDAAFNSLQTGIDELRRAGELGVGHLSIGVSSTLCKYLLIRYLKGFIKEYPHIKISIQSQSSAQTMHSLESKDIDIGLISEPTRYPNLTFTKTIEIHDIFVTTQNYLDHLREMYDGEDEYDLPALLRKAAFILLDKDNLTRQHMDRHINTNLFEPENIIETTTMDLVVELAKIDLGIACVIREFVKEELKRGELIQLDTGMNIPSRALGFCCRRDNTSNRALTLFMDYITRHALV